MTVRVRTVTGTLYRTTGEAWEDATIVFELRKGGFTVDDFVPPTRVETVTGDDGEWEQDLWCDDDSLIETAYAVKLPNDHLWSVFSLPYGDGTDISLGTLLSAGLAGTDPTAEEILTALLEAHEADTGAHPEYQKGLVALDEATVGTVEAEIAHGLAYTPTVVLLLPTSAGQVWQSSAADDTNIYLTADSAGRTCIPYVG